MKNEQASHVQQTQFLIVGTARSGTSLIAHILDSAGADFQYEGNKSWDRKGGDMEHPCVHQAYAYVNKIQKLRSSIVPTKLFISHFKKRLQKYVNALCEIDYLKAPRLVFLVPHLAKCRKNVRLIVIYRDFLSYAKSLHKKFGWDYVSLRDNYINTYKTALIELELHGGVVIDYRDLVSAEKREQVASVLAEETGLAKEDLSTAAAALVSEDCNTNSSIIPPDVVAKEVAELENQLHNLKNVPTE